MLAPGQGIEGKEFIPMSEIHVFRVSVCFLLFSYLIILPKIEDFLNRISGKSSFMKIEFELNKNAAKNSGKEIRGEIQGRSALR
ncbi:MAG: hypothetical protein WC882_02740 [Candidatus Gracilibacteria bacterium]